MTPVSVSSLPAAFPGGGGTGTPPPFELRDAPANSDPVAGSAAPADVMPAETSVAVTELVAALDRAARTGIVPVADAGTSAPQADQKNDGDDSPATQDQNTPQGVFPVVPALANPFAALLAVPPAVAQAIAAAGPAVADASAVTAPRLPDARSASRIASAEMTVGQPAIPSAVTAAAALFVVPKESSPALDRAKTVDVTVTLADSTTDGGVLTATQAAPSAAPVHSLSPALLATPSAADVTIHRHLDLARGDAWLDTLAHDIAASAGTGDKLRFGLQPEHLGRLDVEVSRHDTGVSVHMTTRSEEARAIIAAAQPRLVDDLRANGTRVVAADVTSQMNAQTNGQSGGTTRAPLASFIETAVADVSATAETATAKTTAAGRYA